MNNIEARLKATTRSIEDELKYHTEKSIGNQVKERKFLFHAETKDT